MDGRVSGPSAGPQSEDCLNLDVYTRFSPRTRGRASFAPVPTVLWLYGGSLIAGSTSSYPGLEGLAALEDWVLVAPNYRLGAFGFLAHRSLSATDPRGTSGNYGLLDQQLAMRWVRDNVVAFGGDPRRVLVLGQSSGGTSILALLASKASRGLFAAAVSLSASPNVSMPVAVGEENFNQVLDRKTNCTRLYRRSGVPMSMAEEHNRTAKCLRRLPAATVASLLPLMYDVSPNLPNSPDGERYPGLPLVDGVVVDKAADVALAAGLVDVPLLLQTELAEMDTYENNLTINNMNVSDYRSFIAAWLTDRNWTPRAANIAVALYENETAVSRELSYHVFLADYSFLCGSIELARKAGTAFRAPVYVSVGTRPPSHPLHVMTSKPPARFAGHNWDFIAAARAWKLYNIHFPGTPAYTPTAEDEAWGDQMRRQWYELASTGKISGLQPVVDTGSGQQGDRGYNVALQTAQGAVMVKGYASDRCRTLEATPLGLDKRFWLTN